MRLRGAREEPLLCLVTESARLERADGRIPHDALIAQIAEAAEAGIDLVQIREPDLPAAPLFDLVVRAVAVVQGSRTRVVVNDRLDVALAAGAHGVHLRGTSVDAVRVRAVAPRESGFLVGRSVHSVEEARAAEAAGGLDYLILGTMFPTRSKPAHHPLAGTGALREAASSCRVPVLAIGGITLDNLHDVARAGAAGIAAIGLFLGRHAPGAGTARHLREVVVDIRRIFASSE
jgi:thiamine-phosphate diphosphorylase